MNKNLKRVIAIAMAVGTISAVSPVTHINLLTTKAYASSSDDNDKTTLDKLELETSGGSSIKLYSDDDYKNDNKVDDDSVSSGDTYYAKTSSKKIKIDTNGPSSKYVKVFKGTSSSTKGKSTSDDIELSSGTNTITVKVYNSKPGSDVRFDDSSESEYTLKVKYTGSDSDSSSDSSSDDNASDYDDIYLDSLSVEGNSISLSESKVKYSYEVENNVTSVSIKAEPKDSDDTVYIDGTEVDDSDHYKRTVSLDKDTNEIEVKVKNDDNDYKRVYTLTITKKAKAVAAAATTAAVQTDAAVVKNTTAKMGWVQANGGWQYYDSTGNLLTNQWFWDMKYGNWYYLGADGMMAHDTYIGQYRVNSSGAWVK